MKHGANARYCFGSTNRTPFRMNSECSTTTIDNYPQLTRYWTGMSSKYTLHSYVWVCLEIRDWEPQNHLVKWLSSLRDQFILWFPNFEAYLVYPSFIQFLLFNVNFTNPGNKQFDWHQIFIPASTCRLYQAPDGTLQTKWRFTEGDSGDSWWISRSEKKKQQIWLNLLDLEGGDECW